MAEIVKIKINGVVYDLTTKDIADGSVTKAKLAEEVTDEIEAAQTEIAQTTGDSETAVMSQKAVTDELSQLSEEIGDKIDSIAEVVATEPDNTNLWTLGDITVNGSEKFAFTLPAGEYQLGMLCTSTDTDYTVCFIRFYNGNSSILHVELRRDELYSKKIVLDKDVDNVELCASSMNITAVGDTACFTNVTIVDKNAVIKILSAVDNKAREEIVTINKDVEYIQNPNLYDGEWEVGRYDYDTGKKYSASSTHCRNTNPVPLDTSKGYNIEVKTPFKNDEVIYVYRYDENMNLIGRTSKPASNIIHIEGASFVCFHISGYSTRFPDEPLHVMVWECENENQPYKYWLEYGEEGSYTKINLMVTEKSISDAMLSRDKARFDDSFNCIAYSMLNEGSNWINSLEHFKYAAKQPFTALKGDVQPTSDGVLIMCHDDGFTLNASGQVISYNANNATPIHDMTAEQCLNLLYNGGTHHICSLDEFVKICKKYGKIAFITIRGNYMDEVVPALFSVLDKYNMRKRCIINSFTFRSLKAVREVDNNITLHIVLNRGTKITISTINMAIQLGNCMVSGFNFPNSGRFDNLDAEVIEYAKANDIRLYEAQVDSMEDIDLLMEHGISGAQMTVVPVFD